jgi:hypothetical protein
MLCFEVWLNGKMLHIIGHKDALTLNADVFFHRNNDTQFLGLNAITMTDASAAKDFIWDAPQISCGDEVLIKLVESNSPHPHDHELLFAQNQQLLLGGKTQCSFCGAGPSDENILFDGVEARICASCIEYRHKIIHDSKIPKVGS